VKILLVEDSSQNKIYSDKIVKLEPIFDFKFKILIKTLIC